MSELKVYELNARTPYSERVSAIQKLKVSTLSICPEGRKEPVLHHLLKLDLHRDAVYILLCGGSPDVQDRQGNTLLHFAAEQKNRLLFSMLRFFGANVNIINEENKTPLDICPDFASVSEDETSGTNFSNDLCSHGKLLLKRLLWYNFYAHPQTTNAQELSNSLKEKQQSRKRR